MSRFHNYSFGNVLEIARQMLTATRVAGFWTWKNLGRSVNAGAKGSCLGSARVEWGCLPAASFCCIPPELFAGGRRLSPSCTFPFIATINPLRT